ncbi:hypothetical protein JHK82_052736 [Glycine max]|nr:hypothetical protein JHK86_052585 [Glycine max]KAG4915113.1 hypothetical protein JHK87_052670 [Glycine soja]KAG4926948.1 hypothetical protein JHK85_053434 [Glycine max]KAG5082584.1 hypothetical protein JHK84_052622 [Glycine max]KAG5085339.1 hypothetical protein JHK82_052736 [Glycine max]
MSSCLTMRLMMNMSFNLGINSFKKVISATETNCCSTIGVTTKSGKLLLEAKKIGTTST